MKIKKEEKPQPTIHIILFFVFIGMPFTVGMTFDTTTFGFFYLAGFIVMVVMRYNSKNKIEKMTSLKTKQLIDLSKY